MTAVLFRHVLAEATVAAALINKVISAGNKLHVALPISSFQIIETVSQEAQPKGQQHAGKLLKDKVTK